MPDAVFSPCRTWRYSLTREWGERHLESRVVHTAVGSRVLPMREEHVSTVAFIGLNPSTADETKNDPTVRRCIDFAKRWGFDRMVMLNIYGYRATDPRELGKVPDPVGPDNFCTIAKVVGGADLVVCAWGMNAPREAAAVTLDLIAAPHCLGLTKNGSPRHPLYMRKDVLPVPFAHCPEVAAWR